MPAGEERESFEVPECETPVEQDVAYGASRGGQGLRLVADDSLLGLLTTEIDEAFPDCFKDGERLLDVLQMKGSNGEPYFLVHTDSRFCYNLGGCHNSNRVYFYVDSTQMLQKCYCNCNTTAGRKMGLCKEYSAPAPISTGLKQALFPGVDDILLINVDNPLLQNAAATLESLRTSNRLEFLATEARLASVGWRG